MYVTITPPERMLPARSEEPARPDREEPERPQSSLERHNLMLLNNYTIYSITYYELYYDY